ncbi:conserved Plasmodium protein, unknown function, partial [Plasmodium ovale curtisi]
LVKWQDANTENANTENANTENANTENANTENAKRENAKRENVKQENAKRRERKNDALKKKLGAICSRMHSTESEICSSSYALRARGKNFAETANAAEYQVRNGGGQNRTSLSRGGNIAPFAPQKPSCCFCFTRFIVGELGRRGAHLNCENGQANGGG